jgi:hypothetical protein
LRFVLRDKLLASTRWQLPRGEATITRSFDLASYSMSTNPFEPPQYNFNQPPQPQYYNYAPQQPPQNNLAVGSLVCGILGMLMGLCCPLIGFPLNIAAIAMGAMSMKPPNKGLAIGGLVCGIIGMILTILNAIAGAMLQVWQMQNQGQNPFGP